MNLADCYRVLGLPPYATLTQVKQSYRRLARQYHPDSNQAQSQDYFIQIHQAYQTLRQVLPPDRKVAPPPKPVQSAPTPIRLEVKQPDAPYRTPQASSPVHQAPRPQEKTPDTPSQAPQAPKTTVVPSSPGPVPQRRPSKPYSPVNPQPFPIPTPQATTAPTQAPDDRSKLPTLPKIPVSSPPTADRVSLTPFEQQLKRRSYQQLQELLRYRRFERATILTEGLRQALPTDPEVKQWQGITYHCWARELIKQGQSAQACYYLNQARQADPHNPALAQAIDQDLSQLERRFPKRQLVAI
ncbi:J domain-containing protein [Synechococcus sp. PCC 6312]|uniref:J domain-containing protein n=1 Tax=Synechococcus sp. (strain ATCC 27167 / PCC 6312) TaxID=195253 RepID=UPI00029EC3C7|nr:J domain-containing protein [Synechococcus sp. PCC 6312]AFY60607.1 DnaJ-class molecular chaperone with C-terminal Zn finger domain [Synechococcus sp. PCC 6312]